MRLWPHPGQHLHPRLPARTDVQVQGLRRQQAGRLRAAGQRQHQPGRRRHGQLSQVSERVGQLSSLYTNLLFFLPPVKADCRVDRT